MGRLFNDQWSPNSVARNDYIYIFDDACAQIWQKKAAFAVMADGDPGIIC